MPCELLAVDMPIGLADDRVRGCDSAARKRLPGRASCVFNAPVRGILDSPTRELASDLSRRLTGKGISSQSFGFMRHVREMDEGLRDADPAVRERTWEIHPEVSFAELSDNATLRHPKRTEEGAALRQAALETWLDPAQIRSALQSLPRKLAARDDILDAIVAAWSGARILRGEHDTVTGDVPRDSTGLRMTIAY